MKTVVTPPSRQRQRRRKAPLSLRRSIYEWSAMLLLLSASTVGIILFGAVRNWSAGGLMVLVYAGLILFFLRPLADRELMAWRLPPGGLLFLLFAGYTAALIPFAAVPYEAKVEFLKVLSYVGAYFAWTELGSRYGRWRVLLFVPLLVGTAVALYALVLHVKDSAAVLNMVRPDQYGMRASGTFMAPAHLGAYMGTMICLSFALVLMPSAGAFVRLFSGYGLMLFLPVLFLSGSRSGWVGTCLGLPVVLFLVMWRRGVRAFLISLVVFPLLAGALFATLWFVSPEFHARVDEGLRVEGSAGWRVLAWQDTWTMIQDAPVIGHGPGSYRWTYPPYQTWPRYRWLRYAHNEYLHLWAEYGLIGLALMSLVILTVLTRCLLLYRKAETERDAYLLAAFMGAVVAALGHAIFDFNLHVFSLVHLLVLIGGVSISGCFRSVLPVRKPPVALGWGLGVAGALGMALAALISLQVAASGAMMRWAEDKPERLDIRAPGMNEEAKHLYLKVARIDPSNWLPYLELGNLYRRRAFWIRDPDYRKEVTDVAIAYYEKAHALNPYDMDAVYGLGRSWFLIGDSEKSLEYLERTVKHWPSNSFYGKQLGLQLRQMGRYPDALAAFRQAYLAGGWVDPAITSNIMWLEPQVATPPPAQPPSP